MPNQQKMPAYIGCKIVCARPMLERVFHVSFNNEEWPHDRPDRDGYLVAYPDGYESWSPKNTFEAAYRLVSDDECRLVL